MAKIKKLPTHVISQIAAGEVIERPAYAVKELIENAIDAKATQITIEIKESGLKEICVSDNGIGMTKEDVLESFKPHTTSKIYKEDELHTISTLGFRGEALASIASVSDLTIQSKAKKELSGTKIELIKGDIKKISAVGIPQGTIVTVKNLFANIPARKKFLKSLPTEFRHISDIVVNFALSYPTIGTTFIHNDKTILSFTQKHTLERRIEQLFGQSVFENLLKFSFEESYIRTSGFISRPQTAIKGQSKVFIFINGRRVHDPLITAALKEGYKNLLEPTSYPISFIYITVPFETVDVNIHPRKEQVSFIDQTLIFNSMSKAADETLQANNLTFYNVSWKDGGTKTHLGKILKEELLNSLSKVDTRSDVIQVHDLYLITQTQKGVLFIDQHAAHEALLFRKLKELFEKQKKTSSQYTLESPILLTVPPSDHAIIVDHIPLFSELGFEIEQFGESLRVNKVPTIFKDRDIRDLLYECIEEIRIGKPIKAIDTKSYRMLSYLACRTAIKAGEPLSKAKIREIINDLTEEDMTYTCPHGRPVKIEMTLHYLNTIFKRH